jgi:hypothetical protein
MLSSEVFPEASFPSSGENRAARPGFGGWAHADGGGTAILGNLREVIGELVFFDHEKAIVIYFY